MPTFDIFRNDAFSATTLSTAIMRFPRISTLLKSMNIFSLEPVRTTTFAVEQVQQRLRLIPFSKRGQPLEKAEKDKRDLRYFETKRIAKEDTIQAHEIQNIRAFGEESELTTMQRELAKRNAKLLLDYELTMENMRLAAVDGLLTDADGSVTDDWYSTFGITRPSEVNFNFSGSSPAAGAIRKQCKAIIRDIKRGCQNLWLPNSGVVALCGDDFYDGLTDTPEVRATFLNQAESADLRGETQQSFSYGGIEFINYDAAMTDDIDDVDFVGVPTAGARFFPINTPGVFQVGLSPMESFGFANTLGQELYNILIMDDKRDAWIQSEIYSYPLPICTTPAALRRGNAT